ncbi:hypothetical protein Cf24236_2812 [Citrobacter farmeri]|nr:hypothetical protein Cf24236_2812 [Citrobacter farmeri]
MFENYLESPDRPPKNAHFSQTISPILMPCLKASLKSAC